MGSVVCAGAGAGAGGEVAVTAAADAVEGAACFALIGGVEAFSGSLARVACTCRSVKTVGGCAVTIVAVS